MLLAYRAQAGNRSNDDRSDDCENRRLEGNGRSFDRDQEDGTVGVGFENHQKSQQTQGADEGDPPRVEQMSAVLPGDQNSVGHRDRGNLFLGRVRVNRKNLLTHHFEFYFV